MTTNVLASRSTFSLNLELADSGSAQQRKDFSAWVNEGGGGGSESGSAPVVPRAGPVRRLSVAITTRGLEAIVGKGKNVKTVLSAVDSNFDAGHLTAIMGPSGSGKTSLLNALSGTGRVVKGSLCFNGTEQPRRSASFLCTVVPQDDLLFPSLTPRETFRYVARLRLGDDVSRMDKYAAVEALIVRLGLAACADTPVGNEDIRGISGGEKKRTSIGCEVLVNPAVLLVDEPTSGLDSEMAHSVVEVLEMLAREEGRTVITVIHQPSWRTFCLFDSLVLLHNSRTVYNGPARRLEEYMTKLDVIPPDRANPLDFYFTALQGPRGLDFRDHWLAAAPNGHLEAGRKAGRRLSSAQDISMVVQSATTSEQRLTTALSQFLVLLRRSSQDYVTDSSKLQANVKVKAIIGTAVGIIWLNQGRGSLTNRSTFIVEGAMFAAVYTLVIETLQSVVQTYPLQRPILNREFRNRYYSIGPYFAADFLSRALFEVLIAFVMCTPVYFLIGLGNTARQYLVFMAVVSLLTMYSICIGLIIGTRAKDLTTANLLIVPFILPFQVFSGFFLPLSEIPSFIKFMYYVSPFQYALSLMKQNQWAGVTFVDCQAVDLACPLSCYPNGQTYIDKTHANDKSMADNFLILSAYVVGMGVLAFFSTRAAVLAKANHG